MELKHATRRIVATAVALSASLSCSDDPSEPDSEFTPLAPTDGQGNIPFWTVLDWTGPGDAFHVYLGRSASTAEQIGESVSPPLELTERLSANREYVWFVEIPDTGQRSPLWRFVVINPNFIVPTTPEGPLENLARAWIAHDEVGVDSALAASFSYTPTLDEFPVTGFTKDEVVENLAGLFRWSFFRRAHLSDGDHRARTVELVDEASDTWTVTYPRVPYWIEYVDPGTEQTVQMRLPSAFEVACSSANSGGQFTVRPAWTTDDGEPVYKITGYLSAFATFTGCDGEPQPQPRLITRIRSWGEMIRLGGAHGEP